MNSDNVATILIKENQRHLKQHKAWLAVAREGKNNISDAHTETLKIHIGVIKERIAQLKGKTTGAWRLDKDIWG